MTTPDLPVRVLVVEDDPRILSIAMRALAMHGFVCEGATCGADAMLLLSADPQRFSAALVDLGLPDVAADVLLERIAEVAPGTSIIAMSGDRPASVPGTVGFLQKPFSLSAIAAAVTAACVVPAAADS